MIIIMIIIIKGETMHDLHQATVEKAQFLKDQGYNVL